MSRYKITPTVITYPRTAQHNHMAIVIDPLTHTYWFRAVDFGCWVLKPTRLVRGWNGIVQSERDIDLDTVDMLCSANNRDVSWEYELEEYIEFVKREHALFREKNKKKGTK